MGNDVQDTVLRFEGKSIVSFIWIYKNEYTTKVRGFSQKEGVYYGMTYSIDQTHFSSEVEVYIKQTTTLQKRICTISEGTHR